MRDNFSTVSVETTIDAPRETVFDFLAQPDQIPLVLPGLIENRNIPELPLKVGDRFQYRYNFLGVEIEGDWIVTELDRPSVYNARTTGGGESEWRYRLEERNGGTHVRLDVRYRTPESVLQKVQGEIVERINRADAESLMSNLKTVLELRNA